MKFVDEAVIDVQAGKGGDGCLSFRREKFVRLGGPNGGDGGEGGSVYVRASPSLATLLDFRHRKWFRAKNGQHGMGSQCTGRRGADLQIDVPVGTEIWDEDQGVRLCDLVEPGQSELVAKGGSKGLGNTHFKTATNRAPRKTTKGWPGEKRRLRLELKLLADVGLLGLPNAGKSALLRAISAATPKVADYPFTTLQPVLGVARPHEEGRPFVVADIPGIIEGAAMGAGLGLRFLKHLSRTRLLLHVVDVLPGAGLDPLAQIRLVEKELASYEAGLPEKPRWLILNKMDLIAKEERSAFTARLLKRLRRTNGDPVVFAVSALTKEGTERLIDQIGTYLEESALKRLPEPLSDG